MGRKYAHFDKENTQVANEYKKTCQYRQPLGKWKITMMMKYIHFTRIKMAKNTNDTDRTKCW